MGTCVVVIVFDGRTLALSNRTVAKTATPRRSRGSPNAHEGGTTENQILCAAETRCGAAQSMCATRLDLRDHGAEHRSVIDLLRNVVAAVLRFFAPRAVVAAENLLLHHQLIVLRRASPRPPLRRLDRC